MAVFPSPDSNRITRKINIVNCYGKRICYDHIRRSSSALRWSRGCWGGEGGGEEKYYSACSPCICRLPPSAQGHQASVPHTICEHYFVLANHCDRLERGFTY